MKVGDKGEIDKKGKGADKKQFMFLFCVCVL